MALSSMRWPVRTDNDLPRTPERSVVNLPLAQPYGTVTCIGTLKVDIGSRLNAHQFDAGEDVYEVAPVSVRAGGTAINFASAAYGLFRRVYIIGAVGEDKLTSVLSEGAQAACTSAKLQRCDGQPNAIVVTVRDAPKANGQRRRLLVSSDASPHMCLSESHVRSCASMIATSDILVCDGYALQHPTSTRALLAGLDLARAAGVCTVIDLVPHNLPATISKNYVVSALARADIVIAETATTVGLHGERWPVRLGSEEDLLTRAVACARDLAPSATWMLRYGLANVADTRQIRPDGTVLDYSAARPTQPDQHISGDQVLAHELYSRLVSRRITFSGPGHKASSERITEHD